MSSAAVQASAPRRWFKAQLNDLSPRFFEAVDAAEARWIGRYALNLRSDAGLRIEEVDADEQPELIFSGIVVDQTTYLGGAVTGRRRAMIYIAKGWNR